MIEFIMNSLVQVSEEEKFKIIVPENDIQEATKYTEELFNRGVIPVFEADELEETQNDEPRMILYCERLKPVEEEHIFSNHIDQEDITCVEKNTLCIVRVKNNAKSRTYATADLNNISEK